MNTCQTCRKSFDDSETYEYRGFMFCNEHFDEGIEKVDYKRNDVSEVVEHSVKSQRRGEFINNLSKYGHKNVASDGLPITKVTEPQILKDYENGIL